MDVQTLGAAISIMKGMPDNAASSAAAAQASAQAAAASAETAASHNYGIAVSGTTLTITEPTT